VHKATVCTDSFSTAVRAEDHMVGSKVSKIVGRPGTLMEPGQVILALSS
jgi:hypothetical protein